MHMERSGICKKIYGEIRHIQPSSSKKVRVQPHSNFFGESAAECEYPKHPNYGCR